MKQLHLNTEMIVKQGLQYFDGGSKASWFCILRDRWEKCFGLSKQLNKHRGPRRRYAQAPLIENASLRW